MVRLDEKYNRRFKGRTPGKIKKGHPVGMPTDAGLDDLVKSIDQAEDSDSVLVGEETATPGVWAHKFKKYGPELRLFSQTPDYQAVEQRFNPTVIIPEALARAEMVHRGYAWVGGDKALRVIPLLACVEGAELLALEADSIKVKRYNARLHADVPSRSDPDFLHQTKIIHVPFVDMRETIHSEWTRLRSHNTVPSQQWYGEMEQDRRTPVYRFEPHDIAAFHYAAASFRGGDRPALNPFVIPSPRTADFVEKCRDNVLVSYMRENGKLVHRNLNKTEKEKLLWGYTFLNGGGECPSEAIWLIDNTGNDIVRAKRYLVR